MRFSISFMSIVMVFLLLMADEKRKKTETIRIKQNLKQVEIKTDGVPRSATLIQTVSIRGKRLSVTTEHFWLYYIFDMEKKEIVVVNDQEKSYYRIPFSLMNYYYKLIQEGKRLQLEEEKSTTMKLSEEKRKESKEKNKRRWALIEKFLKKPEPDDVRVVEEELDEAVCGHKAKQVRIYADGRLVVEAVLTTDLELEMKPLALLALFSPLPNKVRKEMAKVEGLLLRYKQIASVGDEKQMVEIEVKEITKVRDEPKEHTIPKDYKEIKEPTIVQNLKKIKETGRLKHKEGPPKGRVK